jgi:hypothetical protein
VGIHDLPVPDIDVQGITEATLTLAPLAATKHNQNRT